jgi:hypothetical protein
MNLKTQQSNNLKKNKNKQNEKINFIRHFYLRISLHLRAKRQI